jgi:uncharacterized protein
MRLKFSVLAVALLCAAGVSGQGRGGRGGGSEVQIKPGEQCPPGTTEIRPGRCQAPTTPPPSILDYRPKSTLVTKETLVPKAKFPVVDIHNHITITAANIEEMVKDMDALNLRVLVNLSGGSGEELKRSVDFIRSSPHKDRFRLFANVNWRGAGTPGWAQREVAALREAVKNGAIGLKIFKDLGLRVTKADGSRLKIDDPEIGPIWDAAGELKIPVIIHTADPAEFFKPIDFTNERWLELALFPNRAYPGLSFEELSGERDRMYLQHPKTTFIGAHFNWYGNDLVKVGKQLDKTPNLVLEVGAVLYEFGRQPRAAHDFFIKYQDRILFGKDAWAPSEYPYYWRVFETRDEYFDYYRDYHAFWKLYGMDLPDAVLKKLYFGNALRIAPGLPQSGWPK